MNHHHDAGSDQIGGRHLDWQLFRRFLGYVRPYRRTALWSLVLLPPLTLCKLVQPYLIKEAIDRAILPGRYELLAGIALLFFAALALEGVLMYAQGYLVQAVGQRIMADLRTAAYARTTHLSAAYHDRHPSGRLVTRLTSDIENVGELFGTGVIAALADLATLAMIVVAMLWLDTELALVSFVVLPPLFVAGTFFRRRLREASRQVRAKAAGLNAYIAERIAGVTEVRLFGQEERTVAEFDRLQADYGRSALKVINQDASLYAVVETLGSVVLAVILWYGGIAALAGAVTFGTLVAFLEYAQKFFTPLRDLSAKYAVLQTSNASLERVFELLDQPGEEEGDAVPPDSGELTLRGVDFSYDGTTPVLQGIDLTLPAGGTVALVGDSGSGKTTLTRLLLGFYRPTAGVIAFGGRPLTDFSVGGWRRRIGWVGQEPFLFSGTLRDNLDPHGANADPELWRLLDLCGARAAAERLGGLDAAISERGRNLSSGERQLLCLTRALALDPPLLILDEATSRLDPASEEAVRRGLAQAGRGKSVILVAHRLATARHADRIVVMRHGRIREEGTHTELLQREGLYARLWRMQELEGGEAPALSP